MKGAIFDIDGTLMDSMGYWGGVMEGILAEYALPRPPRFLQEITPLGAVGAAHYLQKLGLDKDEQAIIRLFEQRILPAYCDEIQPKAGVPAYLRALQAQGVRLCVLTASPQTLVRPCLARTGLLSLFDFSWSCSDVGMTKSDPAIYALTAKELGLTVEDVAFYDDNLHALTTAHEAGVYTVGVYDASSESDRPRIEAVADRYITSFEELL